MTPPVVLSPGVSYGTILYIAEIVNCRSNKSYNSILPIIKENLSVRTLGVVSQIFNESESGSNVATKSYCIIEDCGYCLAIDMSLISSPPRETRPGSLVQVIGELHAFTPSILGTVTYTSGWILAARIVRIVDGMDLELYRRAIDIRRHAQLTGIISPPPSANIVNLSTPNSSLHKRSFCDIDDAEI